MLKCILYISHYIVTKNLSTMNEMSVNQCKTFIKNNVLVHIHIASYNHICYPFYCILNVYDDVGEIYK